MDAAQRRKIAEATKAALDDRAHAGVQLGRRSGLDPGVRRRIAARREAGASLATIAAELNVAGTPTGQGAATWRPSAVGAVLRSLARDAERARRRASTPADDLFASLVADRYLLDRPEVAAVAILDAGVAAAPPELRHAAHRGYSAHEAGERLDANPYGRRSARRLPWAAGWARAADEASGEAALAVFAGRTMVDRWVDLHPAEAEVGTSWDSPRHVAEAALDRARRLVPGR